MLNPVLASVLASEPSTAALGASWWQTLGGLAAVFALLLVCLKLLSRFNGRRGTGAARLLDVWHLAPRREIQVLRVGDEVSLVYRHDNAMVLLKQQNLADYEREHGRAPTVSGSTPTTGTWRERLRQILPSRQAAAPARQR